MTNYSNTKKQYTSSIAVHILAQTHTLMPIVWYLKLLYVQNDLSSIEIQSLIQSVLYLSVWRRTYKIGERIHNKIYSAPCFLLLYAHICVKWCSFFLFVQFMLLLLLLLTFTLDTHTIVGWLRYISNISSSENLSVCPCCDIKEVVLSNSSVFYLLFSFSLFTRTDVDAK